MNTYTFVNMTNCGYLGDEADEPVIICHFDEAKFFSDWGDNIVGTALLAGGSPAFVLD
jgi:hypothetical protein